MKKNKKNEKKGTGSKGYGSNECTINRGHAWKDCKLNPRSANYNKRGHTEFKAKGGVYRRNNLNCGGRGSIKVEAVEVMASAVVTDTATTTKVAVTMGAVGTAFHRLNNHTTTTKTNGTTTKVKGLLYLQSKPMEAPMHGTAMPVKHKICYQGHHYRGIGHQDNTDIHGKVN